jgi:hypothetical protein
MRRLSGLLFAVVVAACLMPLGSAGFAKDINAPLIASAAAAKQTCPQVCKTSGGTWNGKWSTPKGRATSVCGCKMPPPPKEPKKKNINAGPVSNNQQAKTMCPSVCKSENRVWEGEWQKSASGRGGVCTCYRK